jgi:uncharacterized membrane protein YjfL (UPF0719 family)
LLIQNRSNKDLERIYDRIRTLTGKALTYFGSSYHSGGVIRIVIFEAVYTLMTSKKLGNLGKFNFFVATTGLQVTGVVERSSISKKKLQAIFPELYWMLYKSELEMLYFIMEPYVGNTVRRMASKYGNLSIEEIADLLISLSE